MRKLKVCAAVCRHHVCGHSTLSECSHAKAVQAVCHNNVGLLLESECVCFECVYGCVNVCLFTHVCMSRCICLYEGVRLKEFKRYIFYKVWKFVNANEHSYSTVHKHMEHVAVSDWVVILSALCECNSLCGILV